MEADDVGRHLQGSLMMSWDQISIENSLLQWMVCKVEAHASNF